MRIYVYQQALEIQNLAMVTSEDVQAVYVQHPDLREVRMIRLPVVDGNVQTDDGELVDLE